MPTALEGIHVEGIHVEGIHVEGVHVEGIHVEGVHVEGIHVEGIHVEGIHGDRGRPVGWAERQRGEGGRMVWCAGRSVVWLSSGHAPLAAEPCVSSNRMQPLAPDRIWSGLGE